MIFKKSSKQSEDTAEAVAHAPVDAPVMSEEQAMEPAPVEAEQAEGKKAKKKKEKKKKEKKEKAPKTPKSNKPIKLLKKPIYVLSIGDEGAILVYLKDQQVEGRWFAADTSEDNIDVLNKAVAMDPKAPMLIVLDNIDQHYSQQTLPPVNKMSVGGLLKRRASREFGRSMELQGNYLLDRTESKEWNYMMFAVETSEQIQEWFDWVLTLPNPPKGIRVLPLEMNPLVQRLAASQTTDFVESQKAQQGWQYFVTYNKVSGVRQVILREGKMIFTRLGQPLEGDAQTEAGAIEQEVISTVEYLKRIGLKTIHDLQLYIVVGEDIMQVLDGKRMGVESHMLLSPHRVCNILEWDNVAQPEDRFGDVFLAAFIANNKKAAHVLWTKPLQKIKQLYLAVPSVRAVGALSALTAIALIGMSALAYWEHSGAIEDKQAQNQLTQQQYSDAQAKVDLPPEELEKILETFEIYKTQKSAQTTPKVFLLQTVKAKESLPPHMLLQSIQWSKAVEGEEGGNQGGSAQNDMMDPGMMGMDMGGGGTTTPASSNEKKKEKLKPPLDTSPQKVQGMLSVNVLVPGNIKSEKMKETAEEVMVQLSEHYPYYDLSIMYIPKTMSLSDSMDIDFDNLQTKPSEQQPITVKYSFSGEEHIPKPVFESDEE